LHCVIRSVCIVYRQRVSVKLPNSANKILAARCTTLSTCKVALPVSPIWSLTGVHDRMLPADDLGVNVEVDEFLTVTCTAE